MRSSSFHDIEAVRRATTEVVEVFLNSDGISSAAGRIRKPRAHLLSPPAVSSEVKSTTSSEKEAEAIREVRFTAFLSSVTIPIHAIITGMSLEQAR